jgi:hypothetical protein
MRSDIPRWLFAEQNIATALALQAIFRPTKFNFKIMFHQVTRKRGNRPITSLLFFVFVAFLLHNFLDSAAEI